MYRFETTFEPVVRMRLKVEINTREHFSVLGFTSSEFVVDNPWFSGRTMLSTYEPTELLGTKMRALYQRKKGRDLYDLWLAIRDMDTSPQRVVECFQGYLEHEGAKVSRAAFEANLAAKLEDESFSGDIRALLPAGAEYDPRVAAVSVHDELVARLPGAPWKGDSVWTNEG